LTITTALSLQTFDSSIGLLTINDSEISISNDQGISVTSTTDIIKVGGKYINDFYLFDRNLWGIEDPQNYTLFSIFTDLSNIMYDNLLMTPLGGIRTKW